jgi:hypothetical protein
VKRVLLTNTEGRPIFDVSTDALLAEVSARVLKSRMGSGWYRRPDTETIEALIADMRRMLEVATIERVRVDLEVQIEERVKQLDRAVDYRAWYELVQRIVTGELSPGPVQDPYRWGRQQLMIAGWPVAFQLLRYRSKQKGSQSPDYVEMVDVL